MFHMNKTYGLFGQDYRVANHIVSDRMKNHNAVFENYRTIPICLKSTIGAIRYRR